MAAPAATDGAGEAAADRPVDFAFLHKQADGDAELVRELLGLFVAQLRRHLPRMAAMGRGERGETAHLLKGSCRGIGAWAAADAAQAVEDAPGETAPLARLAARLAAAEAAILARLAERGAST